MPNLLVSVGVLHMDANAIVVLCLVTQCIAWTSDYDEFHFATFNSRTRVDVVQEPIPGRWYGSYTAHMATGSSMTSSLAVVPPAAGCFNLTNPETSAERSGLNCEVVTNGGFYVPDEEVDDGGNRCVGNTVADGRTIMSTTEKLPTIAVVTSNDQKHVLVGYINSTDLQRRRVTQAISGQGWLVRQGKNFVADAVKQEPFSLVGGTPQRFISVHASRLALGVDAIGRMVLFAVDGKESTVQGVSLHEFADILISYGVESAINLDGGSSVSMFVNRTLVNVPSEPCDGGRISIRCPHPVSTSICMLAEPRESSTAAHSLSQTPTMSLSKLLSTATTSASQSITKPDEGQVADDSTSDRPWSHLTTIVVGVVGICCFVAVALVALVRRRRSSRKSLMSVDDEHDSDQMDED